MANPNCKCTPYILEHIPAAIINIIHAYLHGCGNEEFYKSKLEKFTLFIRVNKILFPKVEELYKSPSRLDILLRPKANAMVLEISNEFNPVGGYSHWLNLYFVVQTKRYFYGKCLSGDVPSISERKEDTSISVPGSTYRNCYFNLVEICQESNTDTLFADILQTCQAIPDAEDFALLREVLLSRVSHLITESDVYSLIHA